MKAAVLYGNEDIRYSDWETPVCRPGTVKIRVRATGICGSDVPRVLNHGAHFYPVVLGHEFSGDIVEIGGYRGTVEEIGVRTTKVMSMENVKIFRNSNISGVINMTQRFSIAQIRVDVSRAEPYERVEAVFREGFKEIRARIPQAVSDIELCGIDQLNPRSMVLLVQTKCRESDRIEVERLLRRELGLLMEREKIASA